MKTEEEVMMGMIIIMMDPGAQNARSKSIFEMHASCL